MTRNEAIKKVIDVNKGFQSSGDFVDMLEALGLIKFDEEKQIDSPQMIVRNSLAADNHYFQPMNKASNIIDDLYAAGYLIVNTKAGMKFTDCDKVINALLDNGYVIVNTKATKAGIAVPDAWLVP